MGKKLTKCECEAAVKKMYEKTDWQDRIDNAKKAFSDYVLELLKKYIPQEVWDIAKKNQKILKRAEGLYFNNSASPNSCGASKYVSFYTYFREVAKDGSSYEWKVILPAVNSISLSSEEYKKLYNLGKEQDDLERAARQWKSDTVEALYKLNSRTRIQEAFPEALPYLCFDIPQNCAIQVYNYDKLRTCFKKD